MIRIPAIFSAPVRASLAAALLALAGCMPRSATEPAGGPRPVPGGGAEWETASLRRAEARPAPGASLVIPVRGIRAEQLRDTYADPRSGGRTHHAIDIMAPRGTPVMAAADGRILKLRSGGRGGITIYQVSPDGRTLYYYAHLERYAAGIREGLTVQRGQVIAYVGDTGNAGAGNYHLHFSTGRLTDPSRWWESENVNPYPLLAGDAARRAATAARRDDD